MAPNARGHLEVTPYDATGQVPSSTGLNGRPPSGHSLPAIGHAGGQSSERLAEMTTSSWTHYGA
jgi:hypothetical protein